MASPQQRPHTSAPISHALRARSGSASPARARTSSPGSFFLESLEPRVLLYVWTAQEVYLSELINRARANPTAEADRLGLNFAAGLSSGEQALLIPREPLALSPQLTASARLHSLDMATRAFFDHTNPDNLTPTNRAVAAGYSGTAGENIGAGYSSIDALYYDWMNQPNERRNALSLYTTFDSSYHYDNLGPGFALNVSGAVFSSYYTADFGNPSAQTRTPWLLGVVFSDASNDNFYSIGEGAANIRIDVFPGSTTTGAPTATYTTDAAGNYQLPLANGSYTVVFTRPSDNSRVVKAATISGDNVRLNTKTAELLPPPPPDDFADAGAWSSAGSITINPATGSGSISGTLGVSGDTDLFVFVAAKTGLTHISGLPTGAAYDGRIRVYNAARALIADGVDGANPANSIADVSLIAGSTYYILLSATNNTSTGGYTVTVDGPPAPPDDFADAGQWSSAGNITIDSSTGNGSISGALGVSGDTDLFVFVAAKTGLTRITGSPAAAAYDGRIRIYNAAQSLIATGVDGANVTASVASVSLTAGSTYYILFSATSNTSTGDYAISIVAPVPPPPPPDDFANADDWTNAAPITIDASTGSGSRSGSLESGGDSDLFTFTATQTGTSTLTAAVSGSGLTPRLRVYDALHNLLATGTPGDTPANSFATLNLTAGQTYFMLIDAADAAQTGAYAAQVQGPSAPPPPPDDFANASDWAHAAAISLDAATGNGSRSGSIEVAADSDLFTFIAVKDGLTSIAAASGGTLAARIRLYDASNTLISTGSPGTNPLDSVLSATLTAGARYYVLVDSADGATNGDYTVQVLAPTIPPQNLGIDGQPVNALWFSGRPVLSFVNQLGRPIVAIRTPQGQWTDTDLQQSAGSPAIAGDLQTWIDSRDGLLYAAARSSVGVLVFNRTAGGQWSYRNLTQEIAVSRNIVSNLTTFTDSGGLRQIAGLDANGHMVTYWMTGLMWPSGWRYFYTDLATRDLVRRNHAMPTVGGGGVPITSYVTQKNSLNIVATNAAGQVILFFRPGGGLATQLWNWTNLSTLTGAAALVGNITATETTGRIVNISGTDASGNLWMITWRSGEGWRSRNVTAAAVGAMPLVASSLTSWVNSSGAGFVAGLTSSGDIVLYRFTFASNQSVWSFATISASVVSAPRPSGALRATITSTGAILIAGATSTGEVVRFTFDTSWTAESISQLL